MAKDHYITSVIKKITLIFEYKSIYQLIADME